ncbi:tRNA(His) 5'-end guanylyltransferase [Methanolinea mesophila]|uniref:tRNA(His) guanylyltransferase Thg1 family protein n=1 Tax=Methanolinea mesophila TaxID=547055 RepID=UPI001AE70358|nr:tRNA(His) guanylyltransferase Thg1 family protein [Methanolinea mesophila]MBP1929861.1 tRNA(His) 5'-end guanylyltransferase [Methanolinea mesophila]
MKERELFANLITIPPVFVRLDGRTFHSVAEHLGLAKPFDPAFSGAMEQVCIRFLRESGLSPDLAYTFSDEISLYFSFLPFGGRVEKIDSISASFAASALTLELNLTEPLSFDARIIQVTPEMAVEYLINRQSEAWRNHLNAYCQSALVREGLSRKDAAKKLRGLPSRELHEFMYSRGVNLAKTPAWERRGVLVYKQVRNVEGFNPVSGELVESLRSAVVPERNLPVFSSPEGRTFLSGIIRSM